MMFNPFKRQGPEFRVIGNVSEKTKEKEKERMTELLEESHFGDITKEGKKKIEALEYPKSKEELSFIDLANEETNKIMENVGVKPFDVSEKNFHILPPSSSVWPNKRNSLGSTYQKEQVILLNAEKLRKDPIKFGKVSFHELMHLKSHFSLQVEEKNKEGAGEKKITRKPFRQGLMAYSPLIKDNWDKDDHYHFQGINEAIIAMQEKKFVEKMLNLSSMKKQKEWMNSPESLESKKEFSKKENIPEEEIVWIGWERKGYQATGYLEQQRALKFVINEICKEFPDKYKNFDEAEKEFLSSFFTGKLLTIARLVEKTFGKGSFEALGMMNSEKETAITTLEYLKRARNRQVKEGK